MKTDLFSQFARDVQLAAVLLTRLPLPHLPAPAFQRAAHAVWAYPLIGAGVGCLAGGLGALAWAAGLPALAVAALCAAAMALITGAMHEDGLADTADGFWGGWDIQARLKIMKDSHIGTYGVLALILAVALKCALFAALIPQGFAPLIAAAALSRAMMPLVMRGLPPARSTGLAQSVGRPAAAQTWAAAGLGAALTLALTGPAGLVAILAALAACLAVTHLARLKIGGYTGDVLGATQTLTELAALAALTAL